MGSYGIGGGKIWDSGAKIGGGKMHRALTITVLTVFLEGVWVFLFRKYLIIYINIYLYIL